MRRVCITGGAGFIGSALADRLSAEGIEVVVLDDFRSGRREFLADLLARAGATLIEGDVLDASALARAVEGCDWVFHMQANADVRHGLRTPRRDLEQNTIATSGVLEAMRAASVSRIVFASTGSVYGEPEVFPTPEDAPFPVQTSLYAASKLAGEGLIGAYATGYGFTGLICRFVSILGERYTHGHVFDFYRALKRDPARLRVLGDGRQEKSYLYVQDCVSAILAAVRRHGEEPGAHIYNLGTEQTVTVDRSIAIIAGHMGLQPQVEHTGGVRGWPGDSPLIRLDTTRIRSLGWKPSLSIEQAIVRTLDWFDRNEYAWRAPPESTLAPGGGAVPNEPATANKRGVAPSEPVTTSSEPVATPHARPA
jgi:UDP-glucose 4-epimerase